MAHLWEFLAGLGIFLFAMHVLEDALRRLAGRTFKLFLKKYTGSRLGAIGSGAVVAAILQSSSVVSIMALAFVGAGVISMSNAMGVVIGANVGTTLSNWVFATVGFNFSVESFALPIIAVAGIAKAFIKNKKRLLNVASFLLGFGLIFLGLSFMKESIEAFVVEFNIAAYLDYPRIVFVIIGFIITALIQSSTATMVIVLSALHSGVIPLDTAAAIVIGSEVGTSLKIVFGSIAGIPAKKRVALGNVIFNVLVTIVAFVAIDLLLYVISDVFGIRDPLVSLVLFQTIINLSGVVILYPFMDRFSAFLEKRYVDDTAAATFFVNSVSPAIHDAALEALERETLLFVTRVAELNLDAFHVDAKIVVPDKNMGALIDSKMKSLNSYELRYTEVKRAEGEILSFYFKLREENLDPGADRRLDHLISCVRNAMYAAKGMKDIRHNRKDFRNSADDVKYDHYKVYQLQLIRYYTEVNEILHISDKDQRYERLSTLLENNLQNYNTIMRRIYDDAGRGSLQESDVSTLLNVNREMYSSGKAMTYSLKDYLLDADAAEKFEGIPLQAI